jgi:hypothetical protein
MARGIAIALLFLIQALAPSDAFQGPVQVVRTHAASQSLPSWPSRPTAASALLALGATTESAFVPPPVDDGGSSSSDDNEGNDEDDDEGVLDKVEQLGRGGAKVRFWLHATSNDDARGGPSVSCFGLPL